MSVLKDKKIVVGISGGIAAYKVPEFIRLLRREGAQVRVVASKNALQFVTECTLQTVSSNRVYRDIFSSTNDYSTEHVALRSWADLMVVAPATADCMAKLCMGIADDALSTTLLAMCPGNTTHSTIPIVIAPAMNEQMYWSAPIQKTFDTISKWKNVYLIDCEEGELACGTVGKGRMQSIDTLLWAVQYALTDKSLSGQHVLLTAGPTQEAIDPVRFISNRSSGKMGTCLAQQCINMGANVDLIAGPIRVRFPYNPKDIFYKCNNQLNLYQVTRTSEMFNHAIQLFPQSSMTILCAAVSDFSCKAKHRKIKSEKNETLPLTLYPTPDIAAELGKQKGSHQTLIGFALETDNEVVNARSKLQKKGLDYIILNSLNDAGAGFEYDTNKVTIFSKKNKIADLPLLSKEETAKEIMLFITNDAQLAKKNTEKKEK